MSRDADSGAGKDAGSAAGPGDDPCAWIYAAATAVSSIPVGTQLLYEGQRYTVVASVGDHEVCIRKTVAPNSSLCVVPVMATRPFATAVNEEDYMRAYYPPKETVQIYVDGLQEPAAALVTRVFRRPAAFCDGEQGTSAPPEWHAEVAYLDAWTRNNVGNVVPLEHVFQAEFRTGTPVALEDGTSGTITKVCKSTYKVRLDDGTELKVSSDKVHARPAARGEAARGEAARGEAARG